MCSAEENTLFLADFFGQEDASDLLLEYKPDPGRKHSSNGLHGAAGRGLEEEILEYIWFSGADPDVLDEFGATPIMYAMQLSASHDWKTIELLIEEGADPCYRICIDGVSWPYPDIAKAMGKPDLAKLLEEAILEMSEDEETDVPSRS
ncbi:putative ankyrin repeat protein [Fusarium oxysporum f. sp. rapae]|uniref:Putative ankyrin repeat protein n=1 Tax=Fusarium oxysporum f. sp. rapae TaxID=485398 RepID=A0A8J5NJ20_FUSOX|nr:putative ankyrin repeat protein [Fusarium oxysporum f. sp. rapae]KAG7420241.1 putative ankyrin repeat protein [Fusarium oxysporum f. sp. rapae]